MSSESQPRGDSSGYAGDARPAVMSGDPRKVDAKRAVYRPWPQGTQDPIFLLEY